MFLASSTLWAEPFLAGAHQYRPSGVDARRATLDAQGFLWVSGENGTSRFDGFRALPAYRLGLPIHGETRVAVTADGTLWAQTYDQFFRLENNRFRSLGSRNPSQMPIVAAGELLYAPEGPHALRVWFRQGPQWTSALTPDGPTPGLSLHGEPDGRLWFGPPHAAQWIRWTGSSFERGSGAFLPRRQTTDPAVWESIAGHQAALVYDACGVWASSTGPAFRLPFVREILPDGHGGFWGTAGGLGLFFASAATSPRILSHPQFPDRPAFGSSNSPTHRYIARRDRIYTDAPHTAKLCDGSDSRVRLLEPWGPPDTLGPFTDVDVDPDGSVWVLARNEGALHYRADGTFLEKAPPPAPEPLFFPTMREMTFSGDGRLWIASKRNLIEVVRQPTLHYRKLFPDYRYASGFVRDLDQRLHVIMEGGLLRYQAGQWVESAWPACMLSFRVRTTAIASENDLWIGYRDTDGFTHATRPPGGAWTCRHFRAPDGFPGDTQFLTFDRERRLWRGSEAGLFFARGNPQQPAHWTRIPQSAGLPEGEMRQHFAEQPDGSFLLSLGDRLIQIPPRLLDRQPLQPPQLSYLEAAGAVELAPSRLNIRRGDHAELHLAALPERGLAAPAPLEARFAPSGDWEPVAGHRLPLDDAPVDATRLEVRYAGAASVLTLPFRLSVPWWHTLWFRLTAGAGLLLAATALVRQLVQRIRQRRFLASKHRYLETARATPDSGTWPAGTLVHHAYRIEKLLARGGFSDVYAATGLDGQSVVVKRLRQGELAVDQMRRRFSQEVAAVSMIQHPGVLPILDTWIDEDGIPHLVLERIEGPTLRQRLAAGQIPRPDGLQLLARLADILSATHARGVVHSDLKPENIMLNAAGQPVIIDFGTSALHMQSPLSEYTRPAGSVQYMAPEQLLGRYSTATDVYAFACLALEILTGRRYSQLQLSFDDRWESELLAALDHLGLPPAAARCFADGLRFDPARRASDAAAWFRQLSASL